VDQLFPEVGEAVVGVLRGQGVRVDFPPDQTCCGQPLFNSGFRKDAAQLGKRVLDSFEHSEYIVVPSGSCASMMKVFYPDIFRDDPVAEPKATALSGKVYEFSQFLVKVLGVSDVGAIHDGKVTYHPSCHLLRELEVVEEPVSLLKGVKGLEYAPLEDAATCCGFGGTFSVKYPDISQAMLDDKVANVVKSGASTVTACDASCLMQIRGGLNRRGAGVEARHLAQILWKGS
jgi:L-lactate dehydrogenase complex protein LldE